MFTFLTVKFDYFYSGKRPKQSRHFKNLNAVILVFSREKVSGEEKRNN